MTPTNLYQINGTPMLAPDQGVQMSFEDLDASDAGRDEAGFMHRIVVRYKVGVWEFVYSHLSQEEYRYMLELLPHAGTFTFTYPNPANPDQALQTTAYLSGYGITWHCARTGQYRNLKFSVVQC